MSTQPLVLVADDEPRITKLVSIALGEEGFRVVTADSGEEALQKAEEVRPDIILLDIVMPDLDGIEVMRQLRERRPVAVILLTAKGSTADKAKGLDLGADDYIAKPFHPDELAARVRAVLRRSSGAQPGSGVLAFDDVEIDLERRMVTRDGELVQLSRTEWLLLQHLAANAGKVVLHTELLTKVWGPEYRDDLQYLRVWVSRVRRKLGAEPGEPGRIKTFQGIGYLLDVEPPAAPAPVVEEPRRRAVRTDRLIGSHHRRPGPARCGTLGACSATGRTTALIVVDVQNDFADPGGEPERRRRRRDRAVVDREVRMAESATARIVVATQDWHPAHTPHFAKDGGIWPVHCVAGTWGAELHPDLSDPRRRATRPQGRQRRGRLLRLHDARPARPARPSRPSSRRSCATPGSTRVVVVGLATDYCVKATALDARPARLRHRGPHRRDRGGRPRAGRRRAGPRRDARGRRRRSGGR